MEERTILGAGAQSLLEPGLEKARFQSGKIGDQGYTDDNVLLASQEAQRQLPDGYFMGEVMDKRNLHYSVAYYWGQATRATAKLVEVEERLDLLTGAYNDLVRALHYKNKKKPEPEKQKLSLLQVMMIILAILIVLAALSSR